MTTTAPHVWPIRVYYEDTDLAGLVYYANYLRFIERARSEMVREAGIDQVALKSAGLVFAVRSLHADYLSPARYDDLLSVQSRVQGLKPASLALLQDVRRGDTLLFRARVVLALVTDAGRPARIPAELRATLARLPRDPAD